MEYKSLIKQQPDSSQVQVSQVDTVLAKEVDLSDTISINNTDTIINKVQDTSLTNVSEPEPDTIIKKTVKEKVKPQKIVSMQGPGIGDTSIFIAKKQKIEITYNGILHEPYYEPNDTIVSSRDSLKVFTELYGDILNSNDSIIQDTTVKTNVASLSEEIIVDTKISSDNQESGLMSSDWMIGFMLFSLIILAWIKIFHNKYLATVFQSSYNFQTASRLFESRSSLSQRVSFFTNFLACINLGFLTYLIFEYYNIDFLNLFGIYKLLIYIGIIISIYIGKYIIHSIVGYIFDASIVAAEYLHHVFVYIKVLGIVLVPIVIAIPYIPEYLTKYAIVLGIIMFGIFFLFRIIRGIQVCSKINFSIFYLILYLCTLEILPIAVIYKTLTAMM